MPTTERLSKKFHICKFWGQSLSQGHYALIFQQARKGFLYIIYFSLWKKKEEQMVSARAIMMQTSKVMICLYIWTTPPLIYMLTIPPRPWVQTGIISLINKVKTETGFAQSWKALKFLCKSLKSPWIFFNFERCGQESVFWCFLVVQDRTWIIAKRIQRLSTQSAQCFMQ